ncbi:hypothetical protein PENTCL1PPCAC_2938, partial [Pristionchus entomophagus]
LLLFFLLPYSILKCGGKCEKTPKKQRKSSSVTRTEIDGELSSLGVRVNPKKVDRGWSWSREARNSQESSSNASAKIPESSGEEEKEKGKKKKSGKKKSDSSGKKKR